MRRATTVFASAPVLGLLAPAMALAAWLAAGPADGHLDAGILGEGPAVDVEANGADVSVSWPTFGLPPGADERYEVRRYPAGGATPVTVQEHCDAQVAADGCTEHLVPEGEWEYAVVPRMGAAWEGTEGPRSAPVTVTWLSMHVASLGGAAEADGNTWSATALVTVHDEQGTPLSDVTVGGQWQTSRPAAGGSTSCTTDDAGTCEVSATDMRTGQGNEATYEVASLQRSGFTHEPGDDVHGSVTIHRNGTVTPA